MNKDGLLAELQEETEKGNVEIIDSKSDIVEILDFTDGRTVRFRINEISEKEIASMINFGPSIANQVNCNDEAYRIAKTLIHLPAEFFDTLRYILLPETDEDVQQMCQKLDLNYDDFPSSIHFDDCNALGCLWYNESSVIVNIPVIRKICFEMWDGFPEYYATKEIKHCFWETLLHELRHQMLDCNPFLSEDKYPLSLSSEENVENYARKTCENFYKENWICDLEFLENIE